MVLGSGTVLTGAGLIAYVLISLIKFSALALGLYMIRPGQRGILEIAGVAGLISTLVLFYLPVSGLVTSAIAVIIFAATTFALWGFLKSSLSRSIGARTTWRDRHSCDISYPAKFVWQHVVPGEAPAHDHFTGLVESYTPDPEDEDALEVLFKPRRAGQTRYTITFLDKRPHRHCRFYFEGTEADGTLVDGVFSLTIEVVDKYNCTVIANEERTGLSIGALIERWFDDALGVQHDRLIAMLDTLYGDGSGVTKPMPPRAGQKRRNIVSRVLGM